MLESEIKLKLKLIQKELKRHMKILNDDSIQNSATLEAMENVAKMIHISKKIEDKQIPENEIESAIIFIEKYIKQINQ